MAHGVTHLSLAFETFYEAAISFMETVDFDPIIASDPFIPADEPLRLLSSRIESKFAQEQTLSLLQTHPSAHIQRKY